MTREGGSGLRRFPVQGSEVEGFPVQGSRFPVERFGVQRFRGAALSPCHSEVPPPSVIPRSASDEESLRNCCHFPPVFPTADSSLRSE